MIKLKDLISEAEYTHIGFGRYKQKGKEKDSSAPMFKKDGGKFVPYSDDSKPSKSDDNSEKQTTKSDLSKSMMMDKDTVRKIQHGLKKFSHKEKQFFNTLTKDPDSVKRSFIEKIKDKSAGAAKAIKHGLKHELHLFKSAGSTIKDLASGNVKFKDLSDEQKKDLKAVGVKILMTGAVAATGGVHLTAAGVGHLATHTMAELIPHVVGETLLKGIAKAAIFADEDSELEANLNQYAELLMKGLEDVEITPEMMANIVEKNNQSKENSSDETMVSEAEQTYFDKAASAAEYARAQVLKKGYVVDDNDWFIQIGTGGKYGRLRPSVGKTHTFHLTTTKGGRPERKQLHISLYGMESGKYELVYYMG